MKPSIMGLLVALILSSCATILTPKATAYQTTKPAKGQPQRQIRVGYLIADILLGVVPVAVDFGTGKIYKPSPLK
jgi:hypothetical protein